MHTGGDGVNLDQQRAYARKHYDAIAKELQTPWPQADYRPFWRQAGFDLDQFLEGGTMPDQYQPPAFDPLAESQMRAAQIQSESRDIATAPDTAAAWAPPTIDISDFDRDTMTGVIKLGAER
jgi:hypothetical protein